MDPRICVNRPGAWPTRMSALHRFLLTESRIREGLSYALNEEEVRNHARWAAELDAADKVIDYSDERGFSVVSRNEQDTDYVRTPER